MYLFIAPALSCNDPRKPINFYCSFPVPGYESGTPERESGLLLLYRLAGLTHEWEKSDVDTFLHLSLLLEIVSWVFSGMSLLHSTLESVATRKTEVLGSAFMRHHISVLFPVLSHVCCLHHYIPRHSSNLHIIFNSSYGVFIFI